MNISKLVSTIILAASFAMIFLFVIIFYLYGGERSVLKDALSMTASFFGGIATLIAAYIAYSLYVDWRTPHNLNIETEHKKEILKVIRKLSPLEFKYNQLISNHFIYKSDPNFTIPIRINNEELTNLNDLINELLGLLDELYIITKDENIELLKRHYYNYAQLYSLILVRANYLYNEKNGSGLVDFLGTELKFNYTDTDGQEWLSNTRYAHAFTGLFSTKLRKYIGERLKATPTSL